MTFKESLQNDVSNVFLDYDFFGEKRNIKYDGVTYTDVPVVLTGGMLEKTRSKSRRSADHTQALYNVTDILHCKADSFGGTQPEQGTMISISDVESGTYYLKFYVHQSCIKEGMLRVEMEMVTE